MSRTRSCVSFYAMQCLACLVAELCVSAASAEPVSSQTMDICPKQGPVWWTKSCSWMWCPRRASSEWPLPRSSIRAAAAAMKSDPRKAVSRSAHSSILNSLTLPFLAAIRSWLWECIHSVWQMELRPQPSDRARQRQVYIPSVHLPFFNVLHCRFRLLFQRMCILDYAIRNTDRHMDNLLIRHIKGEEVQLAAIDNGLAFPVKHPESISRVRKFSFRWAQQPWAGYVRANTEKMNGFKRFSRGTRNCAKKCCRDWRLYSSTNSVSISRSLHSQTCK